jgi:copper(I)-binding protein
MKIRNLFYCALAINIFVLGNCAYADNKDIAVSNAWVQAMPPSQTTTAVYMTLTNNSKTEAVLTSVSANIASAVEIHQMNDMNGMMHMAMLPNLKIPAQGKVSLQPGGFHIMLIGLKKPVNKGDIVPITLYFQDGSSEAVSAQVKDQQEDDSSMAGMKM